MEMTNETSALDNARLSFDEFKNDVLKDYKIAVESRETSLLGRREVLTGKAKFGIFGDGKELAQIALAKVFRKGDFRSGYYRDQTFMMASGLLTVRQFFAQLYAHADIEQEPMSAGRAMNGHYGTHWIDGNGNWLAQSERKNSSSDISPTAGQMPRLLGLALASKFYRENEGLKDNTQFTNQGNEVAFGTIGDASTSEGLFWETMNAAAVLQVPLAMSIWDDGYGISVSKDHQTVKASISKALAGFEKNEDGPGILIFNAKGWDYVELIETYQKGVAICRQEHIPVLFHIEEITQPQGHSTSGSHERYKSKKRLQWEEKYDCLKQFRKWIEKKGLATEEELNEIEKNAKEHVKNEKRAAWDAFQNEIKAERSSLIEILNALGLENLSSQLAKEAEPMRKDIISTARKALLNIRYTQSQAKDQLIAWLKQEQELNADRYNSQLYSESASSALKVNPVAPT